MNEDTVLAGEQHMRVKRCRHGLMLYNMSDIYIGRSLDLYGEYSYGEADLFERVLRPGMVAIDVGANIGCHTLAMARLVGDKGAVIAFEPQRVVYQNLCANIALNAIANVHALNMGAGSGSGTAALPNIDYGAGGNFGGVTLIDAAANETVPITALDSMPLEACHLIKIDVEGMEYEVLRGAEDTIARHRPALYIENDHQENSARLITHLLAADYRLFWHRPPLYNPDNFFANGDNEFGELLSQNMFCLPRESAFEVSGLVEITSPEAGQGGS
ncbi:MAG: FkbM family methyltransferase [Alphaproteobacteria bacterium]|jgi:FkbM family methyltransferase|nr:FkbM family methyltransferase [Alphaproteobacteria bacterium]MDP6588296.1 FkbM family methyltransferase [Alphaproteobacteria bacterium]